jgi:serine/threonine protein kinase
VIHRDLKPANIMLTQDKGELQVKILDFGMAKALSSIDGEEVVQLTREGVAVGTPRYIAPEQARGLQVGPYTDLYAVGLLIYEVFTGCRAVKADTIEMAVMAHVSPDPLYLPEIELVPAKLHPLLHKLLAKPVNARYQSAAHVLHDLDQIEGRQAPILTNRMPALLAPPRTGPQQAIGAPSQEPEKLELAIPRPITGSMQAVSATRPEDQRPHIEVRREAGSFAQSHGHLVEYLLSPALMSVSFILITAHFYKLPSALRGFTWVIPVIAILIVNTLTGPAWRQPAVRAVNVYSALAILVAHMMGIRALGASLMHQPSWFLSPMLAVPGVQPLVRLIDALFYHYGRFLTAL